MCIEIRIYKYNSSVRKSCNRSHGKHEESEVRDRISLFSSTALPLPMFLKTVRLENARYKNPAILKFRNRRRREREGFVNFGVIEPWPSSGTMVKEGAAPSFFLEKTR